MPAEPIIAVVTPAYEAFADIGGAVRSVLAQTYPHWRMAIVSDDGKDYQAELGRLDLLDPRLAFLSTGAIGAGASRARNVALDQLDAHWCATLDADDRFMPEKLQRVAAALGQHAVVTTALSIERDDGRFIRTVGEGADRRLDAADHKWVNVSMDTMIAWDRRRCDGRYDTELTNLTDLEFLMQLYRSAPGSFHLGRPLHLYVKRSRSMSNGPGTSDGMIVSKRRILARLDEGHYSFASPTAAAGLRRFLEISLAAEQSFGAALAENPELIFEDHLEPMLRG